MKILKKTAWIHLFLSIVIILSSSCSTIVKTKLRGISNLNTSNDHHWNDITKELNETRHPLVDLLAEYHPDLLSQMINDSKEPLLLSFWGKSINFDSNVKKQIVSPFILNEIYKIFNLDINPQFNLNIAHAGVIHTYGYLFSDLETPYGFKRKRWISPTLNYAFDFKENSLSPETISGGLLSNLTYFLGMIVFQDKSELALIKNISNEIFTFSFENLKTEVLIETLPLVDIKTTFVTLPKKLPNEENDFLLIYSYLDKKLKKEWIITAFPITKRTYEGLLLPQTLGDNQVITQKYNAFIEGVKSPSKGKRIILKVPLK